MNPFCRVIADMSLHRTQSTSWKLLLFYAGILVFLTGNS